MWLPAHVCTTDTEIERRTDVTVVAWDVLLFSRGQGAPLKMAMSYFS